MEQVLSDSIAKLLAEVSGNGFIEAPIYQVPIQEVISDIFSRGTKQIIYCVRQTERLKEVVETLAHLPHSKLALYSKTENPLSTPETNIANIAPQADSPAPLPSGVLTLDDVKRLAVEASTCPFAELQKLAGTSQVIICEYKHIFNPKTAILDKLDVGNAVCIVEDAHELQQYASSSRSVNLNRSVLMEAFKNLKKLAELPDSRVVELEEVQPGGTEEFFGNFEPLNPEIPGTIRKQSHFIRLMQRFAVFLTKNLGSDKIQSLLGFSYILETKSHISTETLAYAWRRLQMIFNSANITNLDEFVPLTALCQFATICGTQQKNFVLINERGVTQVSCVNPFPLTLPCTWNLFISPITTDQVLGVSDIEPLFNIKLQEKRAAILPMIVTKGSDQLTVSTNIESEAIQRNYGELLEQISDTIPDGIVVLFQNYKYLEEQIIKWNETLTFNQLLDNKLIFIEQEGSSYLENFRLACESGRGAFLFITKATPLPRQYCRCMVVLGVPQDLALDRYKKARQIFDSEYLYQSAISRVVSAFGLTLADAADYTILMLVDTRYRNDRFRGKFPEWIAKQLKDDHSDLSVGTAVSIANDFMRDAFYNRVMLN